MLDGRKALPARGASVSDKVLVGGRSGDGKILAWHRSRQPINQPMRNYSEKKGTSALALTALFFLFLLLIIVISGGIAIAFGYSPRPRPIGWVLFILGLIVAVFTVDRWAQVLAGIFGIATLNGLIILLSGHALNSPGVPVSRLVGALFTMVMAGASVTTASFADRDLTNTDRVAYLGILSCFVAMFTCVMASVEHWEVPVCIGFIGCIAVLRARRSIRPKQPRVSDRVASYE
jgi:hypothetical protein